MEIQDPTTYEDPFNYFSKILNMGSIFSGKHDINFVGNTWYLKYLIDECINLLTVSGSLSWWSCVGIWNSIVRTHMEAPRFSYELLGQNDGSPNWLKYILESFEECYQSSAVLIKVQVEGSNIYKLTIFQNTPETFETRF